MDLVQLFHSVLLGVIGGVSYAHIKMIDDLKKEVKDLQEKVKDKEEH